MDNVDNLVYNSILAEKRGEEMWMQISWIMWITWISCESNIVFVQPDKFTIILYSRKPLLQAAWDRFL